MAYSELVRDLSTSAAADDPSSGYRILRDPNLDRAGYLVQSKQTDYWQSLGTHDTEDKAQASIASWQRHGVERAALARLPTRPKCKGSPWGMIHTETVYAPGVVKVTTAEHGGFLLEPEANLQVPEALRNANGVYEEDGEWAKVAFAYPSLFTAFERDEADKILRNTEPATYTALTGLAVPLEDSVSLRLDAFLARHGQDYIACSAQQSDATSVIVTAVIGGHWARQSGRRESVRRFRIDATEYDRRPEFGLVIDPARHPEIAA